MKHYLSAGLVYSLFFISFLCGMKKSRRLAKAIQHHNKVHYSVSGSMSQNSTEYNSVTYQSPYFNQSNQINKETLFLHTLPVSTNVFRSKTYSSTAPDSIFFNDEISQDKEYDALPQRALLVDEPTENKEGDISPSVFCELSVISFMKKKNMLLENIIGLKSIFLEPLTSVSFNLPISPPAITRQLLSEQLSSTSYNVLKSKQQELKLQAGLFINHMMSAARFDATAIKQLTDITTPQQITIIVSAKNDNNQTIKHTVRINTTLLAECIETLNNQASSITPNMLALHMPDPLLARRCILSLCGVQQARFRVNTLHVTIHSKKKAAVNVPLAEDTSSLQDEYGNALKAIKLPTSQPLIKKSVHAAARILKQISKKFNINGVWHPKGTVLIESNYDKRSIVVIDCVNPSTFGSQLSDALNKSVPQNLPLVVLAKETNTSAIDKQLPPLSVQDIREFMHFFNNNHYIIQFTDCTIAGWNHSLKNDRLCMVIPASIKQPIITESTHILPETLLAISSPDQQALATMPSVGQQDDTYIQDMSDMLQTLLHTIVQQRFITSNQDQHLQDIESLNKKANSQQRLQLDIVDNKKHQKISFFVAFSDILQYFKAYDGKSVVVATQALPLSLNTDSIQDFLFADETLQTLRFKQGPFELTLSERPMNSSDSIPQNSLAVLDENHPVYEDAHALLVYQPSEELTLQEIEKPVNTLIHNYEVNDAALEISNLTNPYYKNNVGRSIVRIVRNILYDYSQKTQQSKQIEHMGILQEKSQENKKLYVSIKNISTQQKSVFILPFLTVINYLKELQSNEHRSIVPHNSNLYLNEDYQKVKQSILDVLFNTQDTTIRLNIATTQLSIQQKSDQTDNESPTITYEQPSATTQQLAITNQDSPSTNTPPQDNHKDGQDDETYGSSSDTNAPENTTNKREQLSLTTQPEVHKDSFIKPIKDPSLDNQFSTQPRENSNKNPAVASQKNSFYDKDSYVPASNVQKLIPAKQGNDQKPYRSDRTHIPSKNAISKHNEHALATQPDVYNDYFTKPVETPLSNNRFSTQPRENDSRNLAVAPQNTSFSDKNSYMPASDVQRVTLTKPRYNQAPYRNDSRRPYKNNTNYYPSDEHKTSTTQYNNQQPFEVSNTSPISQTATPIKRVAIGIGSILSILLALLGLLRRRND